MRPYFLALLPLMIACSGSQGQASAERNVSDSGSGGSTDGSAVASSQRPFDVATVGQFDHPWAIAFLPNGSALVTEKGGSIQLWQPGKDNRAVAGVPTVAATGQGGLLDIATAPDFAASRAVYLTYAEPSANGSTLALARAVLDGGDAPALRNLQVIFRSTAEGKGGQFGAIIAFSPDGKYLFLTSGERQRFTPAQDPNQDLGKILRLTLDGRPAPGNPFAGKVGSSSITVTNPPSNTGAARTAEGREIRLSQPNLAPAETWSSGHRNPYGLAFAPDGRLWENEMGPRGGDEFNLIEPGKNYGWPVVSNGDNYDGTPIPDHSTRPEFKAPTLWWNPSISPAGLMFYNGSLFRQWKGSAFMGALSGQALLRIEVRGASARKADQWDMGTRVRDVAEGPDGAIYVLEDGERGAGGKLLRLTPKR